MVFKDSLSEQWIDLRLIAGMRVVLGTSALMISMLGSVQPRLWSVSTNTTLVLYCLYGLVIYHLSVRRNPVAAHRLIPWLDLLWYLPLIAFAFSNHSSLPASERTSKALARTARSCSGRHWSRAAWVAW